MYNPKHFEQHDAAVIAELIQQHPLATLVTSTAGHLVADHIPFLLEGELAIGAKLIGHVARGNPVWKSGNTEGESSGSANAQPEALLIFQGPSAYITPNWYPSKQENHLVVPTYNYAVVHLYGKLTASQDEQVKRRVVSHLTNSMEARRTGPWKIEDAPADYIEKMLSAIVAVELSVTKIEAKWKVSQNRSDNDRLGVAEGLARQAQSEDDLKMSRIVTAKTGTGLKT